MDTVVQLNSYLSGRYTVEREIGSGGMATVYLATDARHQRRVALKVLKPEIGAVLGIERFLAEIRVTANLHHPNLLPLFDSGEAEGRLFYVMPYVEGESLRARLERERQLPIEDALRIAVAVAGALEYAHSQGVIHRDLKPENILLQSGQPVVSDFGIALAISNAGGARITQTGLSLGTPQYMSPEQATGDRAIDSRTDIYSLAAVTYEMLTGEPPHIGNSVQAIIARVLTDRPQSVRATRASVPEHVAAAIEKALEKLPADRWASARDFAEALEGRSAVFALPSVAGRYSRAERGRDRTRDPVFLAVAAVAVLAVTAAAVLGSRPVSEAPQPVVFEQHFSSGEQPLSSPPRPLALSPDGRTLVYSGQAGPRGRQLYIRRLDAAKPVPIAGTDQAVQPFFSADGKWIAYRNSAGRLVRIPTVGGPPIEIAEPQPGYAFGAARWFPNGPILVNYGRVGQAGGGMAKIPAGGGTPEIIAWPDTARGERNYGHPLLHPDGRTLVFSIAARDAKDGPQLAVTTLDGDSIVPLGIAGQVPVEFFDDQLLYLRRDGALLAVSFDARRKRATASPIPLLAGIVVPSNGGAAEIAVSTSGTLAYTAGSRQEHLVWMDEGGATTPVVPESNSYDVPRLSRDGKRLAVIRGDDSAATKQDLWVYELASSSWSRLTNDSTAYYPEWSIDGRAIFFTRGRDTAYSVWRVPIDGSTSPERLFVNPEIDAFVPMRDGTSLLYSSSSPRTAPRLRVRSLGEDSAPRLLAGFPGAEWAHRLSPDGSLLAFHSTEAGTDQVYVRPFPGPGQRTQISASGGTEPVWAPDGRHLFFRNGSTFYRAAITRSPSLVVTERVRLFEGSFDEEWSTAAYDVAPSGKRLLLIRQTNDQRRIVFVVNWIQAVRERLAAAR
jgi:Tol biopolymer transport system component/tRNA A-37 threonylcarbamoyl transferase component Bud32